MQHLATAKLNVMKECDYLQKQKISSLPYKAVTIEQLIAELRPSMLRNSLVISPAGMKIVKSEALTLTSGKTLTLTQIEAIYRLTHAASGESEDIHVTGEGSDSLDKSCNKAMTDALKYALRQTFLIETGDDDPDKFAPGERAAKQEPPKQESPPSNGKPANDHAPALSKEAAEAAKPIMEKLYAWIDHAEKTGEVLSREHVLDELREAAKKLGLPANQLMRYVVAPVMEHYFIAAIKLAGSYEDGERLLKQLDEPDTKKLLTFAMHANLRSNLSKQQAEIKRRTDAVLV
jgi:hypothetical protein